MRLLIKEHSNGKTYISFEDTSEIDTKVNELYENFVNNILKNLFKSDEKFMEKYYPKEGNHINPIGLSHNDFSLVHTLLINKDFQDEFKDIYKQIIPDILNLQNNINVLWKDFL